MRYKIFELLTIALAIMVVGTMAASAVEYSLEDAVSFDYVDMEFSATGKSHSGECLGLVLSNNRSYSITVVVAAGTILAPVRAGYQKMVVGRTERVYLGTYQVKSVKIYAFCADFNAKVPTKGMGFSCAVTSAPTALKKVVKVIEDFRAEMENELKSKLTKKEIEKSLVVYDNMANVAVWTVTNNINQEKFTNWLVTEKKLPRVKAKAEVKKMQRIVNYLLIKAGIKKRF